MVQFGPTFVTIPIPSCPGTKGIVSKIGRIISLDEVTDVFEQLAKGELIGRAVIDFRSYK
ncbi:hypothetical protein [Mycoplasmopsis bovis]|uniref:hypothetical protein n=1 Tax=Mycoplasmopsis bovis TaxID=28903 RepID=UPI003D274430